MESIQNGQILVSLISNDFGLEVNTEKWAKASIHDSLVINKEKGKFYWNSKGIVGGPLDYLMKVRGLPYYQARDYLSSFVGYESPTTEVKADVDVVSYPILVNIMWTNGIDNRDYWYRRCLTDHTIDRFKLGWYNDWYLLPIFTEGVFRNFQMRKDKPNKQIRPWYKGVGVLPFNFDIIETSNVIYMTEGPIDAILLTQLGFPAVSNTGGAGGFKQEWFKYFIKTEEVIYIADNDSAGRLGAERVANILGQYKVKIVSFDGFPDHYDTVDFFRDGYKLIDFNNLIEKRKYIFEVK